MKKKIKLLVLLAACFIAAFALAGAGCGDRSVKHTATFVADGTEIGTVEYIDGEAQSSEPSVPEKEGYTGEWDYVGGVYSDITINAIYTPIEYTVTFTADGKEVYKSGYTVENKDIFVPEVPGKPHYIGQWEEYTLTTGDVTVNAVYTPVEYAVTFVADGEEIGNDTYTVEDKEITEPPVPGKPYYNGAWEDYELNGGDVTINAVYTAIEYEAVFIADGKTVCTLMYSCDDHPAVPAVPEKEGYEGEWENLSFEPGGITVNAVYTPIVYNVMFLADGRYAGSCDYTVENKEITEPPVPERQGYAGEWEEYTLTTGNVTVNAVYTPIVYTVTFVADGEEIGSDTYTVEDKEITEPLVPEKEGYEGKWESYDLVAFDVTVNAIYTPIQYTVTFIADGIKINVFYYTVEDKNFDNPPVPPKTGYAGQWEDYALTTGDVTVNAVYTPVEYTVTFIADGKEAGSATFTVENKEITEPPVPEKVGYTGEWEEYRLSAESIIVHAVYTPIEYTVTFIADGKVAGSDTYTVESRYVSEPEVPEKEGYAGEWEDYTLTTGDVTVNAVYTPIYYAVHFVLSDGTSAGYRVFAYGEDAALTAPHYIGRDFTGWYDGETLLSEESSYTFTMPARDVTLTVKYEDTEEMKPFIFTSTAETCTITGVKDAGVTEITVPDCVTGIQQGAFVSCNSLESIYIPGSVKEIERSVLPASLTLKKVAMPIIGTFTDYFSGGSPTMLEEVTATGEYVAEGAMASWGGAFRIKSLTIAPGVKEIGAEAFKGCTRLERITVASSVEKIGKDAFSRENSSPRSVYIDDIDAWAQIQFADMTSNPMYGGADLYAGGELVVSATISADVNRISPYAFSQCRSLKSVVLSRGVVSIGERAFGNCYSLTSIVIPDSVIFIGDEAFCYCDALTDAAIPGSVEFIGAQAFYECESLVSMVIPGGVTSIEDYAFYGCSSLANVSIGKGVKSIGTRAFYGCSSLTSIVLPESVKSIADGAFYGSGLTSFVIPDGVERIGNEVFAGCSGLTSVSIGKGVKSIGTRAFSGCGSLTSIEIPDSVTSIGDDAFSSCYDLASVSIGKSVTSIGNGAFSGCNSLININIPDSVIYVGAYAFSVCSKLTSLTIPESLTCIGPYAFDGCHGLTSVTFKNPDGWMAGGVMLLSAAELSDPATAAEYLTDKYCDYIWSRS